MPVLGKILERMSRPKCKCALLNFDCTLERVSKHDYEGEKCHDRENDGYDVDNYLQYYFISPD
jgi:hypothetical protein